MFGSPIRLEENETSKTSNETYPQNTNNFRYVLAERDPLVAPGWDTFDCRVAFPPSGYLYRPIIPERVFLSLHDSAPQLKIQDDRLTVTGHKGYCTARATHFVNRGRWYFEVKVLEMPEGSAIRLGLCQHHSDLRGPVGFDSFGYSWRSRKGTRFHAGHGKTYGQGYGKGDVLGVYIELPDEADRSYVLDSYKDKSLVKFDKNFYYEIKQFPREVMKGLTTINGSTIEFFKNGYSEGVAFTEIYAGAYYPCVSLYHEVKVRLNFGPHFKHPEVLEDYEARPFSERGLELVVEQYYSNLLNVITACEEVTTLKF